MDITKCYIHFCVKKGNKRQSAKVYYEGINIKQKTPVVLKIEHKTKLNLLESEAYLLVYLKGVGIPEVVTKWYPSKEEIPEEIDYRYYADRDDIYRDEIAAIKKNVPLEERFRFFR